MCVWVGVGNCSHGTNIEHMIIKADDMSLVVRMTSFVRRLLWWCLLIPKFVIAFALTAVGTVWLAATDVLLVETQSALEQTYHRKSSIWAYATTFLKKSGLCRQITERFGVVVNLWGMDAC